MSTSHTHPMSDRLDPPPSIRWRSWPLRDSPGQTLLIALGLAVAVLAVRWASGYTHLALVALVVLLLALWPCFVPIAYEINIRGIERRLFARRRRIPWTAIRRYQVSTDGAVLLPRKEHHPADFLQATFLPWATRREEVLEQLEYYLGPPK